MKTFLWTSLFWILAVIAGILCLGFFNLFDPMIPQADYYLSQFLGDSTKGLVVEEFLASDDFKKTEQFDTLLAENCVVPACDCPVEIHEAVCPTLECPKCEEKVCPTVDNALPQIKDYSEDFAMVKEGLSSMLSNQALILNSFQGISQQISSLKVACESPEVAQKKTEIQSKIEALQAEMANLQNEYNTL